MINFTVLLIYAILYRRRLQFKQEPEKEMLRKGLSWATSIEMCRKAEEWNNHQQALNCQGKSYVHTTRLVFDFDVLPQKSSIWKRLTSDHK